jgi:hypothetical protein
MNRKLLLTESVTLLYRHEPISTDQARLVSKILTSACSGVSFQRINFSGNLLRNNRLWLNQLDSKTQRITSIQVPIVVPQVIIDFMKLHGVTEKEFCGRRDLDSDADKLLKRICKPMSQRVLIEEIPLFARYCMALEYQPFIADQQKLLQGDKKSETGLSRIALPNILDEFTFLET